MQKDFKTIDILSREYPYGFVTEIDEDSVAAGLSEDVIRLISAKKNEPEWMLEWRLRAYRQWLTMTEPTWANVHYPPIDYQAIRYYSAPKARANDTKSLSDVDPELLRVLDELFEASSLVRLSDMHIIPRGDRWAGVPHPAGERVAVNA